MNNNDIDNVDEITSDKYVVMNSLYKALRLW